MRRVLVLRPEPGASATVDLARRRGLEAVAVPLFKIMPLAWQAPEAAHFDGLLLTSANAIRFGGETLQSTRGLPVYAVGEATAEAARQAGFDVAASGEAGVDRLLGSIDATLNLLHLCGEDRREPTVARQAITSIPVYRAKAIPNPDLGDTKGCVALIHSARAGRRLAELISDKGDIAIAAISLTVAEAAGSGWRSVDAAERPDDEALLALTERLCNNLRS